MVTGYSLDSAVAVAFSVGDDMGNVGYVGYDIDPKAVMEAYDTPVNVYFKDL